MIDNILHIICIIVLSITLFALIATIAEGINKILKWKKTNKTINYYVKRKQNTYIVESFKCPQNKKIETNQKWFLRNLRIRKLRVHPINTIE